MTWIAARSGIFNDLRCCNSTSSGIQLPIRNYIRTECCNHTLAKGMVKENVDPLPSVLSTQIFPL